MILAPPAGSKSLQDSPKPGQDDLRSTQYGSKTVLKSVLVAVQNRLRFGVVWGSFWDRFWLPLASPNASLLAPKIYKKSIRNRSALKVAPRSPQERPRPSQDTFRMPQDAPRTPPDAPRCLPGPPLTTQKRFPKHLAQSPFFGKIEKVEIVEIHTNKIDNVHPRWSLDTIAH